MYAKVVDEEGNDPTILWHEGHRLREKEMGSHVNSLAKPSESKTFG